MDAIFSLNFESSFYGKQTCTGSDKVEMFRVEE